MIKGDGIGVDVSEAAMFLAEKAMTKAGIPAPTIIEIAAGASYYAETGTDIQPNAAMILDAAIETGFALNWLRAMEIGGDMGTKAVTLTLSSLMDGKLK